MQIEHLALDALIPYARNARTHSDEQTAQIAGSIREFGFTNPVLIDGEGGIIAGHGRVMAARKLGLAEVPCIRLAHLTDAQKRAYIIADNKLALNAGWDDEMLALELHELQSFDVDLALTGFAGAEIEKLVASLGEEGGVGTTDSGGIVYQEKFAVLIAGQKWFGAAVFRAVRCITGVEVAAVCAPLGEGKPDKLAAAAEICGVGVIRAGTLKAETVPPRLDLIVAAHSHDFIGERTRLRARLGGIGYHPSLLPLHRGRDAARWAVRMRERVTGGYALVALRLSGINLAERAVIKAGKDAAPTGPAIRRLGRVGRAGMFNH